MNKYIKIEALIVIASLVLSLLAFWVEPNISKTTSAANNNSVTTTGWPFAIQKTTAGMDVSYVGPYTTHSTSGMVYDCLLIFVAAMLVINLGWWLVKRGNTAKTKSYDKVE